MTMAGSVTITEEELRIVDAIHTEHVPDAAVGRSDPASRGGPVPTPTWIW